MLDPSWNPRRGRGHTSADAVELDFETQPSRISIRGSVSAGRPSEVTGRPCWDGIRESAAAEGIEGLPVDASPRRLVVRRFGNRVPGREPGLVPTSVVEPDRFLIEETGSIGKLNIRGLER